MGDPRWLSLLAPLITAVSLVVRADDARLNEFMASNQGGIRDEDGNTSDWIETLQSGGDHR